MKTPNWRHETTNKWQRHKIYGAKYAQLAVLSLMKFVWHKQFDLRLNSNELKGREEVQTTTWWEQLE